MTSNDGTSWKNPWGGFLTQPRSINFQLLIMFYKFYKPNCDAISAVTHNALYAASPLLFNDPFEAMCEVRDFTQINNIEQVSARHDNTHRYKTRRFVICLSVQKQQQPEIKKNILMWSHYADSHRGFCVEYNNSLLDSLSLQSDFVTQHEIAYESELPVVNIYDDGYSTEPILTKSRCWEYESEHRFVFKKEGLKYLPNNPSEVISAIYLGTHMDMKSSVAIQLLAFGKENHIPCCKMEYSPCQYELKDVRVC